ncbi:MAG: hypothetical protein NTZ12_11060 [Candidatus Aminicenantes bacterium]|jgi:hypothetical protein|nr:hypothetical protein [Candidatus Aminicenantes bacterium]
MRTEKSEADKRKAYEKPIIRIVNIADSVQVLGIGCKSMTVGIMGPTTNPCIPGVRCNQPGS